jgi:uncharacterized protein (TIGR03435 family)
MTLRLERLGLVRKAALAGLGVAAIAGPVAFGVVRMIPIYGQVFKPTGPGISYEVVVIKPSKEEAHGASTTGEQTQYQVTAKMLIQFAYGIFSPPKMMDLTVVGGPDWIDTDVFDIVGKMESTEFQQEQNLSRGQRHERRQLMEQSLLADRFKLTMHTETRDQPVYALTVAKGGPKMAPAKDATGSAHVNPNPSSSNPSDLKRGLIVRRVGRGFEMNVKGMTLDSFVDALMAQKETSAKPVVNQTGLTGAYDFTLRWGPEETTASDSGEIEEPPLFTAIQQQLGLKLVDGKGPGEVVVIDHIEKPVFDSAEMVAKPSVVETAVAAGQRMLGNLVPAAFVQDEARPASHIEPYGGPATAVTGPVRREGFIVLRQPDAPLQAGGTGRDSKGNWDLRVDSKVDARILFFRMGWAYVLTSGLEFHADEDTVPYNGMPPHGTYGFSGHLPEPRADAKGIVYFIEEVAENNGTIWRANHAKIVADYKAGLARAAALPAAKPIAFDVTTVKPANPSVRSSNLNMEPDGIRSSNLPVMFLLQFAYNLNGGSTDQIIGAPAWISSVPFDIDAKMDEGTAAKVDKLPADERMATLRLMMQTLLAERFDLRLHHETRNIPVLSLEIADGGPKLVVASGSRVADPSKPRGPDDWAGLHNGRGTTEGRDVPVKLLVDALSSKPEIGGRLVVDQTGLRGNYNFTLRWSVEDGRAAAEGSNAGEPSLFAALKEQLGLKLESTKAPVDSIVIDHVERPSEN